MKHKKLIQNNAVLRKSAALFTDYQNLQRICSHPIALRYNSDRYAKVEVN